MERGVPHEVWRMAAPAADFDVRQWLRDSSSDDHMTEMTDDHSHVSASFCGLDSRWVTSLKQKLHLKPKRERVSLGSTSCCIHRVPRFLRDGHKVKHYRPQIISIGPFHGLNGQLQVMNEQKLKYLHDAVSRTGNNSLEKFLMAVKVLEDRARECYSETVRLASNEFVEMMVVDGCFIIELFCKAFGISSVSENDPIFKLQWLMLKLQRDLLLLENQIPYFVLERLFDIMNISHNGSGSLALLAVKFFKNLVPINRIVEENLDLRVQHLLHLLHSNLLPKTKKEKLELQVESNPPIKMIHCITELRDAGIKFKMGEADSFLDIKFSKGEITIPPLRIEDHSNSLLLNLIAFEQCYGYRGNYVTAYAIFMDCLIDSAKDVEVLCHNDIIDNWLGSDGEVADLFNSLGREVTVSMKDFYLNDVFEKVHRYYKSTWHVWRASLMHKYFYNPWAIISLLAAIIFLLLTTTQTLFAIFSYFYTSS